MFVLRAVFFNSFSNEAAHYGGVVPAVSKSVKHISLEISEKDLLCGK